MEKEVDSFFIIHTGNNILMEIFIVIVNVRCKDIKENDFINVLFMIFYLINVYFFNIYYIFYMNDISTGKLFSSSFIILPCFHFLFLANMAVNKVLIFKI